MFECPNCGGDLRFDVASQQMACTYCNANFDPYEIKNKDETENSDEFGVTVFTCPQCNGEIYSTDNSAAGFCSFCGSPNVLNTRLQNEKRPSFIVPFQKTKEDCKREYTKMMRHAIFAPKELKSEKHIESFRGIYMPYWVYYVTQKGPACIKGSTSSRSGDYIITRHYNLEMELDNYYKGLSYDASSSFADNISEKLAPFDVKHMKEFAPSFLSGFYADISDVKSEVYEEDALDTANRKTKDYLKKSREVKKYTLETKNDQLTRSLNSRVKSVDSAMFPVWFMSYRNKDRVAYATVNGQTGKVVSDLPVDVKKYLLGSVALAVPIAILLNMFLTLRPSVLLVIMSVFAAVAMLLHSSEMKQIVIREGYRDDKGRMEVMKEQRIKKRRAMEEAAASLDGVGQEAFVMTKEDLNPPKYAKEKKKTMTLTSLITLITFVTIFTVIFGSGLLSMFGDKGGGFIIVIALILAIVAGVSSTRKAAEIRSKCGAVVLFTIISMVMGAVVKILNPVSDLYYYVSVIVMMAAVLLLLIDLIRKYNILSTRKLPQFEYKGGDDRA